MKNKNNKASEKKGFSLIELIIVVSLIVVLSSIAYVSYSQYSSEAENAKRQADLDTAQTNLELDFLKTESFPSKIQ